MQLDVNGNSRQIVRRDSTTGRFELQPMALTYVNYFTTVGSRFVLAGKDGTVGAFEVYTP